MLTAKSSHATRVIGILVMLIGLSGAVSPFLVSAQPRVSNERLDADITKLQTRVESDHERLLGLDAAVKELRKSTGELNNWIKGLVVLCGTGVGVNGWGLIRPKRRRVGIFNREDYDE